MLKLDDENKEKNPKKKTKGCLHVCVQQGRQQNLVHGEATFIQWLVFPK